MKIYDCSTALRFEEIPNQRIIEQYIFCCREGIVTKLAPKPNVGSYVSIGLTKNALVDRILEPDLRVTVKLEPNDGTGKLRGKIVSPSTPRTEAGLYWGYSVRIASTLSQVFSDCPYDGAYDCTIGTSDKGNIILFYWLIFKISLGVQSYFIFLVFSLIRNGHNAEV